MGTKCTMWKVALWLTVIGAVNWGLVGIGNFANGDWNVVNMLLGKVSWLESVVYILVGIAGIVLVVGCPCRTCKGGSCDQGQM